MDKRHAGGEAVLNIRETTGLPYSSDVVSFWKRFYTHSEKTYSYQRSSRPKELFESSSHNRTLKPSIIIDLEAFRGVTQSDEHCNKKVEQRRWN